MVECSGRVQCYRYQRSHIFWEFLIFDIYKKYGSIGKFGRFIMSGIFGISEMYWLSVGCKISRRAGRYWIHGSY